MESPQSHLIESSGDPPGIWNRLASNWLRIKFMTNVLPVPFSLVMANFIHKLENFDSKFELLPNSCQSFPIPSNVFQLLLKFRIRALLKKEFNFSRISSPSSGFEDFVSSYSFWKNRFKLFEDHDPQATVWSDRTNLQNISSERVRTLALQDRFLASESEVRKPYEAYVRCSRWRIVEERKEFEFFSRIRQNEPEAIASDWDAWSSTSSSKFALMC